jgi:hypothetical protein
MDSTDPVLVACLPGYLQAPAKVVALAGMHHGLPGTNPTASMSGASAAVHRFSAAPPSTQRQPKSLADLTT